MLSAAVSFYWALGGTWLLDTIGGSLEEQARAGNVTVAWAAAALKIAAAVVPLLVMRRLKSLKWTRIWRVLAWSEAAILTLYGLVLTAAGLLVQAGVVDATDPDHRALAWHAYLWDPWFLFMGLLVTAALMRRRRSRAAESSA